MAASDPRQRRIPTNPGVYLIRDARGKVIYVGKARNLRNRMRTYLGTGTPPDAKVAALRERLADFETIVTASETEALILESTLIKEHRPRYNVKLRDDKRYPFIKVTTSERFPRAYVTRHVKEDGSRYFGPYTDAKAMRRTLRLVRQIFPVRQCTTFKVRPRPCLNAQIGRCLAPCVENVSREEYGAVVDQLILFLSGRADKVVALLEARMSVAVEDLRFEEAAALRDRISDIRKVIERQRVLAAGGGDRDVVAIADHGRYAVAAVVRIRGGKLVACENAALDIAPDSGQSEILETFLKQFYSISSDLPREILVDRELSDRLTIETWLSEKSGRRVSCRTPTRGEKRRLVDFARENAAQALRRRFEERRPPASVVELGEALGMSRPPRLISGVDISNVGGALAVGTVVTFRDGRPDRALYRKYRIRSVKGSDDYAMIREVVSRHLKGIVKEEREQPDLLLVDGGRGQLSAALDAVHGVGARGLSLVSLAKKDEEVFAPGRVNPLPIEDGSQALRLLQRVRDEVHRFSVTYHRRLRESEGRRSILDGLTGIGPARKRALLERFGSPEALAVSPVEKIAETPGIGRVTAERIKRELEEARRRDRSPGRGRESES